MIYIIDTNIISDIAGPKPNDLVLSQMAAHRQDTICLCEAVDYEVRRGYLKVNATARLQAYDQFVKPQFQWLRLTDSDWLRAAQLWAEAATRGKALSDVDLLVAAVAQRLDGTIVSADNDFDGMPVKRMNWRNP